MGCSSAGYGPSGCSSACGWNHPGACSACCSACRAVSCSSACISRTERDRRRPERQLLLAVTDQRIAVTSSSKRVLHLTIPGVDHLTAGGAFFGAVWGAGFGDSLGLVSLNGGIWRSGMGDAIGLNGEGDGVSVQAKERSAAANTATALELAVLDTDRPNPRLLPARGVRRRRAGETGFTGRVR